MKTRTILAITLLSLPFAPMTLSAQLSTVAPASLTFSALVNGTNPSSQQLTVTVSTSQFASPNWTAAAATISPSGSNWLSIDTTSGVGNGPINVSVNVAGLAGGSFNGTVTVQVGAEPQIIVPITLNIASSLLSFQGYIGSGNPPTQALQLSLQTGGSFNTTQTWQATATTSSGGNWLSVSPVSGTASTLTVSANITGLPVGTYSGLISMQNAGPAYTQVTLSISQPLVTVAPSLLTFNGTIGTPLAPQTIAVTSGSAWTASAATVSGGPWLSASPASGTGNGTVSVSVSLGGLGAGTYMGTVSVAVASAPPAVVNVTVNVAGPTVSVSPTTLTFTQVEGTTAAAQSIQVAATPAVSNWMASTSVVGSNVSWLSVSPSAGIFPSSLLVYPNAAAAALVAGSYQGTVTIADPNATPTTAMLTVNVSLTVTAASAAKLTVSPVILTPQTLQGITPAPSSLSIANSGSGSFSWNASATTVNGGSWLTVSPTSGASALHRPASVQITYNTSSLKTGVYTGQISVSTGSGSPQVVNVLLTVTTNGPILLLGQTGATFNMAVGAGTQTQAVTVANVGAAALTAGATVINGSWLSVTPTAQFAVPIGGSNSLTLVANPGSLKAGTYWGLVQINATGTSTTLAPQYICVVLNLTTQPSVSAYPVGLLLTPNQLQGSFNLSTGSPGSGVATTTTVQTLSGGSWLQATPTTLSLNPSGTVVVSAVAASLPTTPGVYQGIVTATFANGAPSQNVNVYLVIPSTSGTHAQSQRGASGVTCTPAQIIMAVRALGSGFASTVGWPVNLEAQLVDNCTNPVNSATVLATFSTGDTPLALATFWLKKGSSKPVKSRFRPQLRGPNISIGSCFRERATLR
jgi:hypothetical protein